MILPILEKSRILSSNKENILRFKITISRALTETAPVVYFPQ